MRNLLATMVLAGLTGVAPAANQPHASLLVEAEQFQFSGGWRIGTDSQAGGGRLLAVPGRSDNQPGVPPDRPVHDALTLVAFPISGEYRIWARARDYTTFPGKRRFTITVDDRALSGEAGHHGRDGWAWQELGSLRIESGDRLVGDLHRQQVVARQASAAGRDHAPDGLRVAVAVVDQLGQRRISRGDLVQPLVDPADGEIPAEKRVVRSSGTRRGTQQTAAFKRLRPNQSFHDPRTGLRPGPRRMPSQDRANFLADGGRGRPSSHVTILLAKGEY